ncbi:MAG: YigZ family protein [bacterium]
MNDKEQIKENHNGKSDFYLTIEERARFEIKVRKSKFIATASPAPTKDKAKEILGTIRTEFFDASHNCYAYRIGNQGLDFRASDDGEPNGSAGKPILFAIKKYDLSDLIVVVTRYFGGTKLGVGGLARAYSDAAESVLQLCTIKNVHITKQVKIFCTYDDLNTIKHLLSEFAISFEESYHDAVEIIAEIPKSKVGIFNNRITEATSARAGTIIMDNS